MKNKIFILLILSILLFINNCYAAKYKVNTNGVVKHNGQVVTPKYTQTTQNYYNTYSAQNYVSQNVVNYAPADIIELVMDYSGSMYGCIQEAKKAMSAIVAQVPSTTKLGVRIFGYDSNGSNPPASKEIASITKNKKGKYVAKTKTDTTIGTTTGCCSSTKQIYPISQANVNSILNGMNSIGLGGATPLVYGLDRTVNQDFSSFPSNLTKKIVLITDGGENCGGDPCAFAKNLAAQRSDIQIDVVLIGSYGKKLACLANATKGNFYTLDNLSNFSSLMNQVISAPVNIQNTDSPSQKYEFYND